MAVVAPPPPPAPAPPARRAPEVVVAPAARRFLHAPTSAAMPRHGWRYVATGGRDLRLDLLRGFAVFAMVVDHVGGASWLYALTGGNRFFVSAAEAFVFISGATVGIVYGDRMWRDGLRATIAKLLARAWTLYILAVWLAIATAFCAAIFGLPRGVILSASPARFIFEVLTLQRTFYLVDVMLLYAFLLALSPLALATLRRGGWWLVLIGSCLLWAIYQALPGRLLLPWAIIDNPVFNFAPWQFIFFTGLLIGYGRDWFTREIVARIPRSPLRDGWVALPLALCAGLIAIHATNGAALAPYLPGGDPAGWLDFWFDKSALPLPRLIACAIVFGTAWLVVTRFWVPLRAALGPLLLPLGQRALYAYAAHLFLIIAVQVAILNTLGNGREVGYSTLHPGIDTVIQLAAIGALWALTRARFLQGIVAPLGKPPFAGARWHWRRWTLPRPSDALAALLIVALLSGLLAIPIGTNGALSPVAGGADPNGAGQTSGAPAIVPPASTVTTPRKIAGNARGSSGLVGRIDQQTPTPVANGARIASAAPSAVAGTIGRPTPPLAADPASLPSGGYLNDGEFFSAAIGRTMPYGIYLPPTYTSDPNRRYPVLYMLHGAGGHYSEWVAYGLPEKAEDLTWDGQVQPLIIVMPQGDQSYWSNHGDTAGERWGDYVAFDLVAHIDATYRSIPQATSRAVGGLSMGGFGALQLAFNHPEIFSAVGGHSPALHNHEELSEFFADLAAFQQVDPLTLALALDPRTAPRIWVDTGEEDSWADRARILAGELDQRGISHQVRILPGRHDAAYWTTSAADYLVFYSRAIGGAPLGIVPPR